MFLELGSFLLRILVSNAYILSVVGLNKEDMICLLLSFGAAGIGRSVTVVSSLYADLTQLVSGCCVIFTVQTVSF